MKYLRPSAEIPSSDLDGLEAKLAGFYAAPPAAYHAGALAANEDWSDAGHELHRRIAARVGPGASVLDIGSGSAAAARYFLSAGASYTGLDVSPQQASAAKERFPRAEFIVGSWRDLPSLGRSFDMAAAFFVLEHMARPREFLAASASAVRKGGFLAVLAPEYLRRGFMPSQNFFGRRPGGIRAKLAEGDFAEAARTALDKFVVYPSLVRRARAAAAKGGAWLINLRPVCLEAADWKSDWDAVYMTGEGEVAEFVKGLGFELVELGSRIDGGRHGFCYVLARRSEDR